MKTKLALVSLGSLVLLASLFISSVLAIVGMERVSVASSGMQGNENSYKASTSADGRYVAFDSVATNLVTQNITGNDYQIFVRDRALGTTALVSCNNSGTQGNGPSAG